MLTDTGGFYYEDVLVAKTLRVDICTRGNPIHNIYELSCCTFFGNGKRERQLELSAVIFLVTADQTVFLVLLCDHVDVFEHATDRISRVVSA